MKLEIKNLGKIDYAKLDIKPFTLITGKNATGKTFITKGLYCLLDTTLGDIKKLQKEKLKNLKENPLLSTLKESLKKTNLSQETLQYIDTLLKIIENIDLEKLINSKEIIEILKQEKQEKKKLRASSLLISILLSSLLNSLEEIINLSKKELLEYKLKSNFGIDDIGYLFKLDKYINEEFYFKFANSQINFKTKNFTYLNIEFKEDETLRHLFKNVIYIDSPVYIRLKNIDISDKDLLPEYIYKFFTYLRKKSGVNISKEKEKLLKYIEELIGGQIDTDDFGNLYFKEKFQQETLNIPLSLTAMGITNIAILNWLLKYNYLDKGSVLIIDEPEVHLHPEWQVRLTYLFYELAKYGIYIIIATHSIDIIKAVEVLLKEDKEAQDFISVNKLPYSEELYVKDEIEKVEASLKELIEPYSDLAWRIYYEK